MRLGGNDAHWLQRCRHVQHGTARHKRHRHVENVHAQSAPTGVSRAAFTARWAPNLLLSCSLCSAPSWYWYSSPAPTLTLASSSCLVSVPVNQRVASVPMYVFSSCCVRIINFCTPHFPFSQTLCQEPCTKSVLTSQSEFLCVYMSPLVFTFDLALYSTLILTRAAICHSACFSLSLAHPLSISPALAFLSVPPADTLSATARLLPKVRP